ncbi:unnamed protein product, partial [Rotaria magnacalcarata]
KVFIRKYKDDAIGQQQLKEVFSNVRREKWTTFEIGIDLPENIFVV